MWFEPWRLCDLPSQRPRRQQVLRALLDCKERIDGGTLTEAGAILRLAMGEAAWAAADTDGNGVIDALEEHGSGGAAERQRPPGHGHRHGHGHGHGHGGGRRGGGGGRGKGGGGGADVDAELVEVIVDEKEHSSAVARL